ncbi:MAG: hypothetical protein CBB68_15295 [Rhodospirillaceae bacterium TMED8]|nr:cobalamin biosynthesis bifunctional protein CbiET [Magnetovibrio sp.]OUT47791.1 MAG: hypothetical protein CBB68_15295 [Rhodospirillaceae bacterium TMED8]
MNRNDKNWLNIVGIGEDGIKGLSLKARQVINTAEVLIGGKRHLAKIPSTTAKRIVWGNNFYHGVNSIREYEGKKSVVVLASGDPMHFGAGSELVRRFGIGAMNIIPTPSAFSLAAAHMGWSIQNITCLTVHGRALEQINRCLHNGALVLILSWDGSTPGKLAKLLSAQGYPDSRMTVLEHMGGKLEKKVEGIAGDWQITELAALNTIALECVGDANAVSWSRAPGLPEQAFHHDNIITKREVRALTLAALAPRPREILWDVGAGSGTVAIEWLRVEPSAYAVAIERDPQRIALMRANAYDLGVPELEIIEGVAPAALSDIGEPPDAIFIGGGVSNLSILKACHESLKLGGRLVANAVTLEARHTFFHFREQFGGEITQINISRSGPVGRLSGLRPMLEIWQLYQEKT